MQKLLLGHSDQTRGDPHAAHGCGDDGARAGGAAGECLLGPHIELKAENFSIDIRAEGRWRIIGLCPF